MEIRVITKKEFFENENFFRKNLGLAYNYDRLDELKKVDASTTNENLQEKCQEVCEKTFNSFKKCFTMPDYDIFLAIATEDGRICSIASFEKEPNKPWYIDAVSTRVECRKRGFATKVISAGIAKLKDTCVLHVDKNNEVAFNLYKRLGFELSIDDDPKMQNSFYLVKTYGKPLEK